MRFNLCDRLPDLAQHLILEYLDYKWRCGKFIRQLPRDLPIYQYLKERPEVKERYFNFDDPEHCVEYYDDGSWDLCDEYGNKTYFAIEFVLKYVKRKYYYQKVMEIRYCGFDRELVNVNIECYDTDYDGSWNPVVDDECCVVMKRW